MQHYLACDKVRIDGITVINRNNYNNDALDLDGCHDVTVSNMIADSDDDAITLYNTAAKSNRFGTQDKPNKNVIRTWATTQEKSIQRISRPK